MTEVLRLGGKMQENRGRSTEWAGFHRLYSIKSSLFNYLCRDYCRRPVFYTHECCSLVVCVPDETVLSDTRHKTINNQLYQASMTMPIRVPALVLSVRLIFLSLPIPLISWLCRLWVLLRSVHEPVGLAWWLSAHQLLGLYAYDSTSHVFIVD